LPITLSQLAERLGAEVDRGLADPGHHRGIQHSGGGPGCLVFAEEEVSFAAALASSAAAFWLGRADWGRGGSKPVLRTPSHGWPSPGRLCCCAARRPLRPSTLRLWLRPGCRLPARLHWPPRLHRGGSQHRRGHHHRQRSGDRRRRLASAAIAASTPGWSSTRGHAGRSGGDPRRGGAGRRRLRLRPRSSERRVHPVSPAGNAGH
jgi:hypothetical protein